MGVDLKLLPIDYDDGSWGFSHSIIRVERDYELFDQIRDLPKQGHPPENFTSYLSTIPSGSMRGESCYGPTKQDCYGCNLYCVRAGDFANIRLRRGTSKQVRAVLAYVRALDPDTRIVPYWC